MTEKKFGSKKSSQSKAGAGKTGSAGNGTAKNGIKKNSGAKTGGKSLAVIAAKKPVRKIVEYYYFLTQEVDARMLQGAVSESWFEKADIWPQLNLMEVVMNFDSLIFQDAREAFVDPLDLAWFEEKGIKAMYQISYDTGDSALVREVMGQIMEKLGGRICSDTDDFEPSFGKDDLAKLE